MPAHRHRGARLRASLALAGACAAAAAGAGEPWPAPLALSGAGPYYTLRVPMALRSAARREDLADLRVRNAAGETLPQAWLPERTEDEAPQAAPAALYPAPAPAPSASEPLPAHAWIVDAGAPGLVLERLELALAAGSQGVFTLRVDASDDLQHWRTLQSGAQLVQLDPPRPGPVHETLRSTAVELGDAPARYLRLTSAAGEPAPVIEGATVLRGRHAAPQPAIEWSAPIAPASCDDRRCDYALPANVPVEWLQVELAQPSSVALLDVLAQVEPTAPPYRHGVRGALHALRAKERAQAPPPGWSPLAQAHAWWLQDVGGAADLRSPPLRLDAGPVPALRLQSAGSLRSLGPRPPALRIGVRPATLVFLARGPAPYRLELAAADEPSPAMTLAQLMPARRADEPLPADTATPAAPAEPRRAAAPVPSPASHPGSGTPVLWAALLAGVGLMGAMAWSLLRRPGPVDVESGP